MSARRLRVPRRQSGVALIMVLLAMALVVLLAAGMTHQQSVRVFRTGHYLAQQQGYSVALGAEDFAFMLEERPGAYIWLGTGPAAPDAMLHGARYDFNDEMLPVGATYWARLVESELAA